MGDEDDKSLKNWRRTVDSKSGRVYYYHKVTRETRWDAPFGSEEMFLRGWYSSVNNASEDVSSRRSSPRKSDLRASMLPEMNIKEAVDPRTGKTYFYDRVTRQTFWHDPRLSVMDSHGSSNSERFQEWTSQQIGPDQTLAEAPKIKDDVVDAIKKSKDTFSFQPENKSSKTSKSKLEFEKMKSFDEEIEKSTRRIVDHGKDLNFQGLAKLDPPSSSREFKDQGFLSLENEENLEEQDEDFYSRYFTSRGSPSTKQGRGVETSKEVHVSTDSIIQNALVDEEDQLVMRASRIDLNHVDQRLHYSKGQDRQHEAGLDVSYRSNVTFDDTLGGLSEDILTANHIQSSLILLKKRMNSKRKSPRRPQTSWNHVDVSTAETETIHRPVSALQSKSKGACTRRTGCTCSACSVAYEGPVPVKSYVTENPNGRRRGWEESGTEEMYTNKPPRAAQKITRSKEAPKSLSVTASMKQTSWRSKSNQLRLAMQRGKQGTMGSTLSTTASSFGKEYNGDGIVIADGSDGLIPCPHCNRTFNPKSAERHIPLCAGIKAKPKTLLRGGGKGAYVSTKTSSVSDKHSETNGSTHSSDGLALQGRKRMSLGGVSTRLPVATVSGDRVSVSEKGVRLEPCPYCARQFGRKAFDRHVEHCSKLKAEKDAQASAGPEIHRKSRKSMVKEMERATVEVDLDYSEEELQLQILEMLRTGQFNEEEEDQIRQELFGGQIEYDYEFDNDGGVGGYEEGPFEYIEARDSLYQ